jgi:hypothetical protein
MPSGHLGRPWTGPAAIGGHAAAAAGAWQHEAGREPPLAELLDDPIMALLWRADRLDPTEVRAELRALRLSRRPPATSGARDLAA